MAGVIKKKKALFEDSPALPKGPKGLSIREAEGGYIVSLHGEGNDKVAKTVAAVVKIVKETLADGKAEDESEDE